MNMYAEIIARAEVRRVNLEKFQKHLHRLPDLLDKVEQARGQLKDLLDAWNALDVEGKQLMEACFPGVNMGHAIIALKAVEAGPIIDGGVAVQLSRLRARVEEM